MPRSAAAWVCRAFGERRLLDRECETIKMARAKLDNPEPLLCLLVDHARVPWWIPDEIDARVFNAFQRHNSLFCVCRDHRSHPAARCGQGRSEERRVGKECRS